MYTFLKIAENLKNYKVGSLALEHCMYKVIVFVFAGIASGFTLVSIFSEDACMQVAATIVRSH